MIDKTIWKYPLEIEDEQEITMPEGASILSVADQGGRLCMWVLVNPNARGRKHIIRIYGTGHPCPNNIEFLEHLGTVVMSSGNLVWHVFYDRSPKI